MRQKRHDECFMVYFTIINMQLDFEKPTKNDVTLVPFYFIPPDNTLIHYLCAVALPGLADWSAF